MRLPKSESTKLSRSLKKDFSFNKLSDNIITKARISIRIRDPCSLAVNVDYYLLEFFRRTQKWLSNLPGEYIRNDET